jgi:hypothetical protein
VFDRITIRHAAPIAVLGALFACAPALASSSGGAGIGAAPTPTTAAPGSVGNAHATVSASGGGISLFTTASALLRGGIAFHGNVPASDRGRTVEIERLGHETNWSWEATAHATVGSGGTFTATWVANHIGQFSIRAVIEGTHARAAAASPAVSIVVYRPSVASWYGPGFFGRRTACGIRLTRTTLGVANRTLPCGTKVALLYRGRTLEVPVIDRGPFANGAEWDLTEATSQALGVTGTVTIGAASLPRAPGA